MKPDSDLGQVSLYFPAVVLLTPIYQDYQAA